MASDDDQNLAAAYRSIMTWAAIAAVFALLALGLMISGSKARDLDGRYAQSPLKPWFDQLRSHKGPCCSDADGSAVSDVDWETHGGKYRVRVPDKRVPGEPMVWLDVPDEAVITEPNRAGRTMVWPIFGIDGVGIRCFMPGSMI